MDLNRIKLQFEDQYIKYLPMGGLDYTCKVRESNRFGSGAEVELYFNGEYQYGYWCEWDGSQYTFEKMIDYRSHRMSLSFSCGSDFTLYTDRLKVDEKYPAFSYNVIEDKVEKYCRTNMMQTIREQLAEKILSGELEINVYCSDMDGYDCPPSKIRNQIIEI